MFVLGIFFFACGIFSPNCLLVLGKNGEEPWDDGLTSTTTIMLIVLYTLSIVLLHIFKVLNLTIMIRVKCPNFVYIISEIDIYLFL